MYDEYDQPETYNVPINISDNGGVLGGRIKTRNMIEAVVIFFVFLILWKIFMYPFGFVIKAAGFMLLVLPPTTFGLIGIRGESFVEFICEYIFFRKKARKMVYHLPVKLEERKKKKFWKKDGDEEDDDDKHGNSEENDIVPFI